jgi:hypothetical protein
VVVALRITSSSTSSVPMTLFWTRWPQLLKVMVVAAVLGLKLT